MARLIIAVIAVVVLLIGASYLGYTGYFVGTSQYDEFAQCLTDNGAVMYGAYWCPHCNNQKLMFGSAFEKINYVECDPNGPNGQPDLCKEKGVTGYPTWIIKGKHYRGEQTLADLGAATDCQL